MQPLARPPTVVFDFDGVLCDGFAEGLLVSWNAWHGRDPQAFSQRTLSSIPEAFRQSFLRCRCYARHLGHFVLCFSRDIRCVRSQAELDALYATLSDREVESFVERVSAYRRQVRELFPERWLGEHSLYPGIRELLCTLAGKYFIVSAKDSESILAILQHHGVSVAREQVYGECREKRIALADCAARANVHGSEILFCDDNVLNAADAMRAGYRAVWADWGYQAPDHMQYALLNGLQRMSLRELTESAWGLPR